MKTTIITTVVAILLSITAPVLGSDKLYKNVVGDKESGIVTTTVCKSSSNGSLTPLKQTVFYYNSDKSLKERTSYKWDSNTQEWVVVGQHRYEYNSESKLMNISFLCWNKTTKSWHKDVQYAMYVYDANNIDHPVKYLSVNAN